MSILDAANLIKRYGALLAVNDVSLRVNAGEILGLLGPNGAGKTTTMSMIAGLIEPDAGAIHIDGQSHRDHPYEVKRKVGLVPQDLAIYQELTARENLEFFGRMYGLSGGALKQRTDEVLGVIGLQDVGAQRVGTFSGGMKRRLNFGIGLLHEPTLLILDEPTVGVDPQSRVHLLAAVREVRNRGVAVLYASHYMEEVQTLCDRIAIMDHGKVLAEGLLGDLLRTVSGWFDVEVSGWAAAHQEALKGFCEVQWVSGGSALLSVQYESIHNSDQTTPKLMDVLSRVIGAGLQIDRINTREPNLEEVFLQLTGHHLRD